MARHSVCDTVHDAESLEPEGDAPIAEYLETIAILQDEVARLERELQARADDREQGGTASAAAGLGKEVAASERDDGGDGGLEADGFRVELASRDETIRLLMEELLRVEDAQAATRAEWEQLSAWVANLEQRVEGQDETAVRAMEDRMAVAERTARGLESKNERDRLAWESQRQIYQAEIARLEASLVQAASSAETAATEQGRMARATDRDAKVVEALEAENMRLRAAWQEAVERASVADRSEALEAKLAETLNAQDELNRQLAQIEDDRTRERLEYQASVAEMETRLTQVSLVHHDEPAADQPAEGISASQEMELRLRALRQHLVETGLREQEERQQKRLVNRLSRLWSRTGPR